MAVLTMPERLDVSPTPSHTTGNQAHANGEQLDIDSLLGNEVQPEQPAEGPSLAEENELIAEALGESAATPNDEFDHQDDANVDCPPLGDVPPTESDVGEMDPDEGRPEESGEAASEGEPAAEVPTTATRTHDDWFRDQFNRIYNAELSCMKAECRVEVLKADLKEAKETLDERIVLLRGLCREMEKEKGKDYPLFTAASDATPEPSPEATSDSSEPASEAIDTDTGTLVETLDTSPTPAELRAAGESNLADESWRDIELGDVSGISDKLLGKLYAADIQTIGALVDYQQAGKELTGIKGVGAAAVKKIGEALEGFWEERNKATE